MKQITLGTESYWTARVCAGKLALVWGLYGYGVAWLWQLAGSNGPAHALTWAVALVAGLLLLGLGAI